MKTRLVPFGKHVLCSRLFVVPLLLMVLLTPGASAQTASPTVGEIHNFVFDCATGAYSFDVYVENVAHVPEGTSGFDYPLFHSFHAYYESGDSYFPSRWQVWSPSADQDPYTGIVTLTGSAPLTEVYGDPSLATPISSIDLYVGVGSGSDAYAQPTDESRATYTIDCSSEPPLPPVDGNGAGVPEHVTLPEESNVPANPGPPAGLDLPENAGPPEERGKPENPGRPENRGKNK